MQWETDGGERHRLDRKPFLNLLSDLIKSGNIKQLSQHSDDGSKVRLTDN